MHGWEQEQERDVEEKKEQKREDAGGSRMNGSRMISRVEAGAGAGAGAGVGAGAGERAGKGARAEAGGVVKGGGSVSGRGARATKGAGTGVWEGAFSSMIFNQKRKINKNINTCLIFIVC